MRVAMLSFGGPAGQIAVMHRIFSLRRRGLDAARGSRSWAENSFRPDHSGDNNGP